MRLIGILMLMLATVVEAKSEIRVLMVINEGFQPNEYFEPRAVFEKEGYKIVVASRFGEETRPGKKYKDVPAVRADLAYDQIKVENFDVITFTGGGGAWSDYFPNKTLHQVLLSTMEQKKVVGLICAGTGLLATAGNLNGKTPQFSGKKVTGYGEVEGLLVNIGKVDFSAGDLTKPYVVTDGNLITGRDPLSSKLFGETIVSKLGERK